MEKFETYIEKHQNIMSKLPGPVKEKYLHDFEDRDAYLQNFKGTIEKFFTSKKDYTHSASIRSRSHKSRHSSRSQISVLSKISSKKLIEEQRKAKLETQREALQKKKEIELAEFKLQIEEEDLQLKTFKCCG